MNYHSIANENISFKSKDKVVLDILIPESSDFFDGHFPTYKILPAVGQFEIVKRFLKKYFNTNNEIVDITRIKFSSPIRPNTRVYLEINKNIKNYNFVIFDFNNKDKIYSSGSFIV